RVGRAFNGNAVLTGIEVESFPRDKPNQVRRHDIQWLWADVSQTNGDYRFTNLLVNNKDADRGWAADAHNTPGDRQLLVLLKDPIAAGSAESSAQPTYVRVRLRYESIHAQHVFGRVRLTLGSIS